MSGRRGGCQYWMWDDRRDEKSLYEWFYFPLYQTVINLEQLAFKWQKDHIFVAYL